MAYYRFNEASGIAAFDATTNHLNGTLTNRPLRLRSYWWPVVRLNSADPLTNECHSPFVDPTTVNEPLVAISTALERHTVALRADGRVVVWGDNSYGQRNVPASATNVVAVAAGATHCMALRADGTLVAWGDNSFGQCNIPAAATNVVAIAAGDYHCLALKGDGTVLAWGANDAGQLNLPATVTNVVAIAGGSVHSVALKADGTTVCWGRSQYGETRPPDSATNLVAVAAGLRASLGLRADGTAIGWGDNTFGQIAIPTRATNLVAIAGGTFGGLALAANGTLVAWGMNNAGQNDFPASATNMVAITVGRYGSLALKADGAAVGWGWVVYGQTTPPAQAYQISSLPPITGLVNTDSAGMYPLTYGYTNALGAAATGSRTVVVADTLPPELTLLGDNPLLLGVSTTYLEPGATATDQCMGDMTASIVTNLAVNPGVPGVYTNTYTVTDGSLNTTVVRRVVAVGVPLATTLPASGLMNDQATLKGAVNPRGAQASAWFEWGPLTGRDYPNRTAFQDLGSGTNEMAVSAALKGLTPGVVYHARLVAASSAWTVRGAEKLFWTPLVNLHGPGFLTLEAGVPFVDLTAVEGLPLAIAAGFEDSLALRADGTVFGWGRADFGQISIPASVTNAVALTAGWIHGLALRADGTLVGWGDNGYGKASILADATNVLAVAAGRDHNLALRKDGTVVAWGGNYQNQVAVPAGLSNVVAVAAGLYHSLALKRDGTVVAWGYNESGQSTPPPGLSNVVAIAGGAYKSLAVRADSTVVGWGNYPFAGLTNVTAVAMGEAHDMFLWADGTVMCWGANDFGQAGTPAGLSNVVAIAAGQAHSLALRADGTIVGWGGNNYGQLDPPAGLYRLNLPLTVSGAVNTNVLGTYVLTYTVTNALGGIGTTTRTVVIARRPLVTTEAATNVEPAAATMNGTVNARASDTLTWFEYGLDASYGSETVPSPVGNSTNAQPFSTRVTGLLPWMTYHYRAVATNALGRVDGADATFTVPGPSVIAPSLSALSDVVLPQGGSTSVWFTVLPGAAELRAGCNNSVLLPAAGLTLLGSGTNRGLAVTPARNQSGSAQVTLTAMDGSRSVTRAFNLTVTPPSGGLSSWLQLAHAEGAQQQIFRFQIMDAGAASANYAVEYRSDLSPTNVWRSATNVVIKSLDGGVFTVDAVTPPGRAGFYRVRTTPGSGGAGASLAHPERAKGQTFRFQIADAGTASTNYTVEYRLGLSPTNAWNAASNAVITALGGGLFQVDAVPVPGDAGFYRVKGYRLLMAGFDSDALTFAEGAGTVGPVIVFNGIYTGPLTCIWTDEQGTTWTNQVQVNGTTVVIPLPPSYLGENAAIGQSGHLTLQLLGGTGFALNGIRQSTVTLEENDSEWQGVLQAGSKLDFELTILQTNGCLSGQIQSEGFGFFPTNALAQLNWKSDAFIAVATNIALPTLVAFPALCFTNYLDLRLEATNSPGQTNVSPTRIQGSATLVTRDPNGRHLDSAAIGTFMLLKPPTAPSTNHVPLTPAP